MMSAVAANCTAVAVVHANTSAMALNKARHVAPSERMITRMSEPLPAKRAACSQHKYILPQN